MQLSLKYNLPFTTITIAYKGVSLAIPGVLIDTGSGSTVLSADLLSSIQIAPEAEDILHLIRGVGGSEMVFIRCVDFLQLGEKRIDDFEIEVGAMDYGFQINGILGMDFLRKAGAVINLQEMNIKFAN